VTVLIIILIHVFSAFFWSFSTLSKISVDQDYLTLKKIDPKIQNIFQNYIFVYIILNLLGLWIYTVITYMRGTETTKDHIYALKIISKHLKNLK